MESMNINYKVKDTVTSYNLTTDVKNSYIIPQEDLLQVKPSSPSFIVPQEDLLPATRISNNKELTPTNSSFTIKETKVTNNESKDCILDEQKLYNVSTNVGASFVIPSKDLIINKEKVQVENNLKNSNTSLSNVDFNDISDQELIVENFDSYIISTNVLQSYVIPAKDLVTKNKQLKSVLRSKKPYLGKSKPTNMSPEEIEASGSTRKLRAKRKLEKKELSTSSNEDEEFTPSKKMIEVDSVLERVQNFKSLPLSKQKMKLNEQEEHIHNLMTILNSLRSSMNNVTRSNKKKEDQIAKLKNLLADLGMEIVEEDTLVLDL